MADVLYSSWGTYAQWFREDKDGNCYVAKWWGERSECIEKAKSPKPPRGCKWVKLEGWEPDSSPGSACWCETYGDNR